MKKFKIRLKDLDESIRVQKSLFNTVGCWWQVDWTRIIVDDHFYGLAFVNEDCGSVWTINSEEEFDKWKDFIEISKTGFDELINTSLKPFQKVLVKNITDPYMRAGFYSHSYLGKYYVIGDKEGYDICKSYIE